MLTGENTSYFSGGTLKNFSTSLPSLVLLAVLLPLPVPAEEQDREVIEGPGVSLMFSPRQEAFARTTLSVYNEVLAELENRLGLAPRRETRILLSRTQGEFREVTGGYTHTWIAALAYPSQDLIIIDGSRIQAIGTNDLRTTLSHELTHLLLGQVTRGKVRLPTWFNEGVAMWASIPRFPFPREELVLAAKNGTLIPYSDLVDSFPASQREAELAYDESHEFVAYLEQQFGGGTIKSVLGELGKGLSVEGALMEVTGKNIDQLWNDWVEGLYRRSGLWATVKLVSRRGLPLFGIIAAFVVLGYMRYLWVKRRKMKQWEEEEHMGYW